MVNKGLFSSTKGDWETPQWLFNELNKEFNFAFDVCAVRENCKVWKEMFKTKEDGFIEPLGKQPFYLNDCFKGDWFLVNDQILFDHTVFMNPPYGREISKFIQKAYDMKDKVRIVCLLPARTDTKWWSIFWDRENHKPKPGCEVRLLEGRLKFGNAKNSAPFPSAIVIMNRGGDF